jgi:hypothetical protein
MDLIEQTKGTKTSFIQYRSFLVVRNGPGGSNIRTVSLMFLKNQGGNENLDACKEVFHGNDTIGNEGVRICQIIF